MLPVAPLAVQAAPAVPAATTLAATDPSFLLRARFADLRSYFPSYLGNGFIATLTAPRGTEPTQTTMVALMDYTPGDVSRPALIPGWNGIDFNPGPAGARREWLDRGPMSARRFKDYEQTLDLHDATLTTRYRYVAGRSETSVEVVTLVSEASPHLAATRFTLTPHYDGVVRLSFPLKLWAPHTPRFPFARLTGAEQDEALAAHGLSLMPRPPATADRAALWYPGTIEVRSSGGDARSLSLWLAGKATHGLTMAMAAAVSLPRGVRVEKVTLDRRKDHLALDLTVRVARGRAYTFTKFVAMSRAGWGGDARQDLALARAARNRGFAELLTRQRLAWHALWQTDIEIEGDPRAQQVAHSELYYLLAGSTPDTGWAVGPCAITLCYVAHVFWDSDTWIFPALLLLHPQHAQSLVDFRARTLAAAEARAKQHGFAGAMYPWESDPQTGTDVTPHSAVVLSDSEIHVNSEVAIAQWQYYLATLDRHWLRAQGWPVIRAVARFWASRASYDPSRQRYEILHVTSVSESHNDIPNDTFTNFGAVYALEIADAAAKELAEPADPAWSRIARGMYIPLAADGKHHLPFDPSVTAPQGQSFGAGPLSLIFLPALDLVMPPALRRADYDFAIRPIPMARSGRVSIGIVQQVTAADEVGQPAAAAAWFKLYLTGGTLKPPFEVRTETASNNAGPFITGSGGYLQSLIFGLTGLRIREAGLIDAFPPVLPPGWHSLTLRNIMFRGRRLTIRVTRDPSGAVRLTGLH
jgi:Glycosyl hydrolase family 65 central catalytic domain/Glycosyl hydrolase family 65, N-terminal domain/Glycosyl hydrolase family 65, C-terminal domain